MNIFLVIIVIIATITIFGLPLWNLSWLYGKHHIGWLLLPPMLFLGILASWQFLETLEMASVYHVMKQAAFYWLITGTILFATSVVIMIIEVAFRIPKIVSFWLIVGITITYVGIALINGQRIVTTEIELPAQNISREYQFVHITDLHSGSTDRHHAQRVVDRIKAINPEFVVITGDFIDEQFVTTRNIEAFNQLTVPVYLITGNHEYYLKDGTLQEVIEGTNIILIDSMKITFEELDIIGVNELESIDSTLLTVGGIDENRYTILLDHQPKTQEVHHAEERGVQLMLSGHTHKGQIWPMELLIKLQFKYVAGLYEVEDMFLYVSQGVGTIGPLMRAGSVNEIVHIHLIPKN